MKAEAVDFRIILCSRLQIGTGQPSTTADDTFPRGLHGVPMIPASTIKGAVRAAAAARGIDDDAMARCFGRTGWSAGAAVFTAASPVDPAGLEIVEVTTVALDQNRVAVPGALTAQEVLLPLQHTNGQWRPVRMQGQLWAASGRLVDLHPALVGLASLTDLGRRTRRGFGRVQVALSPRAQEAVA